MRRKKGAILPAAVALSLLFTGCGQFGGGDTERETEMDADTEVVMETKTDAETLAWLQGHWVDVNGDTTLDFDGDRMTLTSPWQEETFQVTITGESIKYIKNTDPESYDGGFDMMSSIWIKPDGALSAGDMVLDAKGHEYRFVREEAMADELEIKIKDRALPKTIGSDEIVLFRLDFSNTAADYDIPADGPWYGGRYEIEAEKTGGGDYTLSLWGMGESYVIVQYDGAVSEDYVKGLAALVREQKLAENNGWWRENNEDFPSWSVHIEYASGEEILMEASGRAALECPFSIYAFLKYANLEAGFTEDEP